MLRMSMKAETVFGAAFLVAVAFLAYGIFALPSKRPQFAAIGGGFVEQDLAAHAGVAKK